MSEGTNLRVNSNLDEIIKHHTEQAVSQATGEVIILDGMETPFVTELGETGKVSLRDMSQFLPNPLEKSGAPTFADADGFARFIELHETNKTQVMGDVREKRITAVFDDHNADEAGWARFQASLQLVLSDEFHTWGKRSGRAMSTKEFKSFLEENAQDLTRGSIDDPLGGADKVSNLSTVALLEAVSSIRVHSTNQQVITARGATTDKEIKVVNGIELHTAFPEVLYIQIPIFEFDVVYNLQVRLLVREDCGDAEILVSLDRDSQSVLAAFQAIMAGLTESGIEAPIYLGKR